MRYRYGLPLPPDMLRDQGMSQLLEMFEFDEFDANSGVFDECDKIFEEIGRRRQLLL